MLEAFSFFFSCELDYPHLPKRKPMISVSKLNLGTETREFEWILLIKKAHFLLSVFLIIFQSKYT